MSTNTVKYQSCISHKRIKFAYMNYLVVRSDITLVNIEEMIIIQFLSFCLNQFVRIHNKLGNQSSGLVIPQSDSQTVGMHKRILCHTINILGHLKSHAKGSPIWVHNGHLNGHLILFLKTYPSGHIKGCWSRKMSLFEESLFILFNVNTLRKYEKALMLLFL